MSKEMLELLLSDPHFRPIGGWSRRAEDFTDANSADWRTEYALRSCQRRSERLSKELAQERAEVADLQAECEALRAQMRPSVLLLRVCGASFCTMSTERPKKRADCKDGPRPCPWISCKYSTFFDTPHSDGRKRLVVLKETSTLKIDKLADEWLDQWETCSYSCSLDAADDGPLEDLEIIADSLGITVKNVATTYARALQKVRGEVVDVED